jgi:hypothetical protein
LEDLFLYEVLLVYWVMPIAGWQASRSPKVGCALQLEKGMAFIIVECSVPRI